LNTSLTVSSSSPTMAMVTSLGAPECRRIVPDSGFRTDSLYSMERTITIQCSTQTVGKDWLMSGNDRRPGVSWLGRLCVCRWPAGGARRTLRTPRSGVTYNYPIGTTKGLAGDGEPPALLMVALLEARKPSCRLPRRPFPVREPVGAGPVGTKSPALQTPEAIEHRGWRVA